jgi:hypothetical protein
MAVACFSVAATSVADCSRDQPPLRIDGKGMTERIKPLENTVERVALNAVVPRHSR